MSERGNKLMLNESKTGHVMVGLFVVVAAVAFGWLLFSQQQGPDRYTIIAEFDTMGSINEATKVKLRGFTIGQVRGVDFRPRPPSGEAYFLVELGIDRRYEVPQGTIAEIRGSGLVGEAFVHLDVTEAGVLPLAKKGARIKGRSDPGMKDLMTKIKEAAQKLGSAGSSLANADLGNNLARISSNVSRIADDLGRVSRSADSLLVGSRHMMHGMEPGLQRIVDGMDQSLSHLSMTLSRTDTLIAGTSEDVRSSVHALRMMVERMEKVLGRIDTLVQYKEQEIDETLTNLHAASSAVREITQHPWKLITGQGVDDDDEASRWDDGDSTRWADVDQD